MTRISNYITQFAVGCDYLYMPLIPTSGPHIWADIVGYVEFWNDCTIHNVVMDVIVDEILQDFGFTHQGLVIIHTLVTELGHHWLCNDLCQAITWINDDLPIRHLGINFSISKIVMKLDTLFWHIMEYIQYKWNFLETANESTHKIASGIYI